MTTNVSAIRATQPLVSVGMPTHNRPVGLRQALACITSQTYRNLEIIVSDNASPGDAVDDIVQEFMATDARITYFRQSENIGATANFQFTLDQARGEYFLWASDDDLCEPDFIEALAACMQEHPSIVLAMSDVKLIADDDSVIRTERLDSIRVDLTDSNWQKTCGLFFRYPQSNIFFCIYGLYRTDAVRSCSLNMRRWGNYLFSSEVPFLAQLSVIGKIASIPSPLKLYRSHADSLYIKELRRVTLLDKLIRGAEIRLQLAQIALSSSLDRKTKALLLANNAWSWLGAMAYSARRLPAKIKNCLTWNRS